MNARLKAPMILTALAALLAGGPAVASGGGMGARYVERELVLELDRRCRLFDASVRASLDVAARQARNAALREGTPARDLDRAAHDARVRAQSHACQDPETALIAGRVEQAFSGWRRMARMSFPGTRQGWSADRYGLVPARALFALHQDTRFNSASARFGQRAGQVGAHVRFAGRSRPVSARIVMRDPRVSPQPWLAMASLSPLPPAAQRRVIWSVGQNPLGVSAQEAAQAQFWAFPATALDTLESLDPREGFTLEFVFRDDSVLSFPLEVGDLSAARAFLTLGPF